MPHHKRLSSVLDILREVLVLVRLQITIGQALAASFAFNEYAPAVWHKGGEIARHFALREC